MSVRQNTINDYGNIYLEIVIYAIVICDVIVYIYGGN